jgi:hypothetical protein
MADYLVPFGVDASPFLKAISDMEAGTEELAQQSENAGKRIKGSYSDAGEEIQKLTNRLKTLQLSLGAAKAPGAGLVPDAKNIAAIEANIKKVQDRIGAVNKAFQQEAGILQGLANEIKNYQQQIVKATDPARILFLNKQLQATQTEFSKLSNAGKAGFDDLGNTLEKTAKSTNVLSKGFGFVRQAAYLIPGIGLAGIFNLAGEAVVALAGKLANAGDSFNTIAEKIKLISEVQKDANKQAGGQLVELDALYHTATNVALADEERIKAAKTLQAIFPDTFKNLSTETILLGGAKKAYEDETAAIIANANAKAAKDKLDDLASQRLDIAFQKLKITNALNQQINNATPNADESGVVVNTKADVQKILQLRRDELLKEQDIKDQRLKKQQDFLVQFAGGENKIAQVVEDANASALKAEETAKDKLEKLRAEQLRNYNDLLTKFTGQQNDLAAKALEDDRASALAVSDAKFQKIKDDVEKELRNAKVNEQQRAALRVEGNKVIEEADAASAAARLDINKKFDDKQLKLQQDAQKALASISGTKQGADIQKIQEHYAELTETIRKGGLLTADAQKAIDTSRQREIADAEIKFGADQIKRQEALDVEGVKIDQKYADKSVATQKAKQLAILAVELDAAERQLELLQENGKEADSEEVKRAVQVVQNLKNQIAGVEDNKGKGKTLFEALGIGPEAEQKVRMYATAASEAGKITADFLNTLADAQQAQLDAQKAKVDQDNADIDTLQQQLDREKELKDQGFANNYDRLQQELVVKKQQREDDLKHQKEVQAKQNALRKAAIIADGIAQVSNLITAASEIFSVFAEIPFVGVPLAIAAIALMFGSFAAAKITAFNSVGKTDSFGKGGYIDGKPHSQGGKKYVSTDGSGNVVELEGGEHVTNKASTRKYSTLLDAINSDDLGGMSDEALREMLAAMGIGLSAERPKQAVQLVRERNGYAQAIALSSPGNDISGDVKNISTDVRFLASKEKSRTERWQDGKFYYEKTGATTVKIEK